MERDTMSSYLAYYTYSMNIHIPRRSDLVKQQLTIYQK